MRKCPVHLIARRRWPIFGGTGNYNRDDDAYRALLGKLPYYAIWDDHEVVNDFGPLHNTRTALLQLTPIPPFPLAGGRSPSFNFAYPFSESDCWSHR